MLDAASDIIPLLLEAGFSTESQSLEVYTRPPHPGQQKVRSTMKRFNTASCGRRFGKTFLAVDWDIEPAVDPEKFLRTAPETVRRLVRAKGMGGLPVAWFAPTFKMVEEVFADMVTLIGPENISSSNKQKGRIELKNGGKIDFWSLEAAPTLRGRFYARIVVDEAAHVTCDLADVWEKVIRPTLSDLEGDAFFISTPNGFNFFRTLYERGEDSAYPDWMSWQLPTTDNPYIQAKEVEAAREEMDEQSFKQEYLAEFLRDEGKVFRNVEANLTAPEKDVPENHRGHKLHAGVDWAQIKDFTVNAIGCETCGREVFLERFNQIEFHTQRRKLIERWIEWNVTRADVEENSIGRPNYEELARDPIYTKDGRQITIKAVRLTSESKPKIIQRLALSLEKVQFKFLPDRAAKNELLSYEGKINRNGNLQYSAPSGGHDDTVIARGLLINSMHTGGRASFLSLRFR